VPVPERSGPARSQHWWMTGLLAVAFTASIAGLHVLLEGGEWFAPVFGYAMLALLLAAICRSLRAPAWLPTLVSAAGVLAVTTLVFAPRTGLLLVVPTGETLDRFGELFAIAGRSIGAQAVPADPNQPIVFVLCLGVAVAAIVADLLATGMRSPALAGVPLITLLAVPGFIVAGVSDPLAFIVVAVCYLAMLRAGRPRGQGRLSLAIAAVAVVAALLLPAVLPEVAPDRTGSGQSVSTGVNPVLTLGDDLRASEERTVLEYSTA